MIKEFVTGRTYRYTGLYRPSDNEYNDSCWNCEGEMDFALDGQPRIAIHACGKSTNFIGTPSEDRDLPWGWSVGFENWVEVTRDVIATEGEY